MKENIIIEIPFNEKVERENQNFYFKYIWNKIFKILIKYVLLAALFLFLGFYPIKNFDRSFFYYFFKYGGIFLAGYSIILINSYFTQKRKFKESVDNLLKRFISHDTPHLITITDESIEFKNPLNTVRTVWNDTSYILAADYLIISAINHFQYIIHKSEMTNAEFDLIMDFLHKNSKITAK